MFAYTYLKYIDASLRKVYDLGADGQGLNKVAAASQHTTVQNACHLTK